MCPHRAYGLSDLNYFLEVTGFFGRVGICQRLDKLPEP